MKKLFISISILFLFAIPMMAQTVDFEVNPELVETLLAVGVIGGFGVIFLTDMLKKLLKATGPAAIAVSIFVSSAMVLAYLLINGQFNWIGFIVYSVVVAFAANRIYLFPKARNQ